MVQENDINPSTFYNWISRLRRKGMIIPTSAAITASTATELQQVVKVELIPDHAFMSKQPVSNDCPVHDAAAPQHKEPAVVILLGNSTIRLFQGADRDLIEAAFRCLGGNAYAG